MKPREKQFCQWLAILGEPTQAAQKAGYRHPEEVWPDLLERKEIADEVKRIARALCAVYENTAKCSLYRVAYGGVEEALTLLYDENPPKEKLSAAGLLNIAEIKRTKDKTIEIKFFDRLKAAEKLAVLRESDGSDENGTGLINAMRLSAEALNNMCADGATTDEV